VQQPCSNLSKSPETWSTLFSEKNLHLQGILQAPEISSKVSYRLCTAEGRGSNTLGSTPRTLQGRFSWRWGKRGTKVNR
jgi:hypothetical protein